MAKDSGSVGVRLELDTENFERQLDAVNKRLGEALDKLNKRLEEARRHFAEQVDQIDKALEAGAPALANLRERLAAVERRYADNFGSADVARPSAVQRWREDHARDDVVAGRIKEERYTLVLRERSDGHRSAELMNEAGVFFAGDESSDAGWTTMLVRLVTHAALGIEQSRVTRPDPFR